MKNKITDMLNKVTGKHKETDEIGMAVNESDEHPEHLVVAESSKQRLMDKIKGNMVYIIIAFALIVPGLFKLYGFLNEGPVQSTQTHQNVAFNETPTTESATPSGNISEEEKQSFLAQLNQPEIPASSNFPQSSTIQETPAQTPPAEYTPPEQTPGQTPPAEYAPPEQAPAQTPPAEYAPLEQAPGQTNPSQFTPPENASNTPEKENAARSMLASFFPIGGGSEEQSGKMTQEGEGATASEATSVVASLPGAPAEQGASANQILNKYFEQESKMDAHLEALSKRLDSIEENMAALSALEKRIASIEAANNEDESEQLTIVQNKLNQLEQGMTKIIRAQHEEKSAMAVPATNEISTMPVSNAITVEAVVPGRAWVRNQEGVLMVVQVGDEINGVGKVTRIDAREGLVATANQIFKQ